MCWNCWNISPAAKARRRWPKSRTIWTGRVPADRPDWAADPVLADDSARAAHIATLYERLAQCLAARDVADWVATLDALQIPCSPVNRLDDLADDPHVQATGLFMTVDHPTEGAMRMVRPPVRFSATPLTVRKLAPG